MAQDDRRLAWRFYSTANDEQAARKVVDRVEAEVGRPIDVESVERYWKDASMQVVDASTAIASTALAYAVLETLELVGRVAHRTGLQTPEEQDGEWWFEGLATKTHHLKEAGIEMLTWSIAKPRNLARQNDTIRRIRDEVPEFERAFQEYIADEPNDVETYEIVNHFARWVQARLGDDGPRDPAARRAFEVIDSILESDVLPDANNLASEFIETFWDDPQALDLMPERSRAGRQASRPRARHAGGTAHGVSSRRARAPRARSRTGRAVRDSAASQRRERRR